MMEAKLSLQKRVLFGLTLGLIFLGILGAAEGIVRISTLQISSLEFFTKANFNDKVKLKHGQQIFEGDALLGWKLTSNLHNVYWDFTPFSTNKQGVRYPADIKKKQKDAVRIIVWGDSVVFGFRVPVAFPEDPHNFDPTWLPFPALMENKLRQSHPGWKIEVIPLAVPGYSSYQGLKWLERDIGKLKPDLVIVHFGWNDTEWHTKADKAALSQSWFKVAQRRIISQSQALIYLTKRKSQIGNKKIGQALPTVTARVSKEEYITNILAMARLAGKWGAPTLVLGQVYRDAITNVEQQSRIAAYRRNLAAAMHQAGIPYLEIEKLTEKGYPENKIWFGEAIHPNHLGHQIMAGEILEFIRKEELLRLEAGYHGIGF